MAMNLFAILFAYSAIIQCSQHILYKWAGLLWLAMCCVSFAIAVFIYELVAHIVGLAILLNSEWHIL